MIALRLLTTTPQKRDWLIAVLEADPGLKVVLSAADSYSLTAHFDQGADVILVDLAYPRACEARFWAEVHVMFPWSRLVALIETPVDPERIAAALHAGAYYMVGWTPRYLVKDFLNAIATAPTALKARVIRVNPPPAPHNQRVLFELEGFYKADFEPMSSEEFQPLVM